MAAGGDGTRDLCCEKTGRSHRDGPIALAAVYVGHKCTCHNYICHNYLGLNYTGHNYIGRIYARHNFIGHY